MIGDPLVAALALALGLVLGAGAGAAFALRLVARRRAELGAHAQLARLWPAELPARSAADILAGVVHVSLGGQRFDLPVLPRAASRAWLDSLDARFADLATELEAAGNDTPMIMARLVAEADALYDMLLSYDKHGVLPPRDAIDEVATDTEILRAVLEVWRAVNPLAATVAETTSVQTLTQELERRTSPPRPTAGAQRFSSTSSPTSSSSSTSTPPPTGSSETPTPTSSASSRPSASARSSRMTGVSTADGGRAAKRSPLRAATASPAPSSRPR